MPTLRVIQDAEYLASHPLRWQERAACTGQEDLFIYDSETLKVVKKIIPEAMAICDTCPVLLNCNRWSRTITNWSNVVVGGVYYGRNGKRYER